MRLSLSRGIALGGPVTIGFLMLATPIPAEAQTYTTLRNNGPASNRANMVLIGDGYTAAELNTTYATNTQSAMTSLFSGRLVDPYPRYANFFNVYSVSVASNQSGADNPGTGIYRDTALDASYWWDGDTDRLLYFDTAKADAAISTALHGSGITPAIRIGLVNDSTYGGGGGDYAVYAAGNHAGPAIAIHEIGHSFAGLADEYDYGGAAQYTGPEPYEANVTKSSTGAKWSRWLGYKDPAHPGMSVVGAYEGASYCGGGIYRPTADSLMRNLNTPMNAIGREQTILTLYKDYVHPLDGYLDNSKALNGPTDLWVDVIDPGVINVDWYVNGVLRVDNGLQTLHLADLKLPDGTYTISARAYDNILDLEGTGLDYDWVRSDESYLQQNVTWTVTVPEPVALLSIAVAGLSLLFRPHTSEGRPGQRSRRRRSEGILVRR